MGIQGIPTPEHWNYFLSLEDDVIQLARYLEPTERNFSSYSLELARILFAASSEVDVICKRLCLKINVDSKANNIMKYRDELLNACPQIKDTRVEIPRFGLKFHPWEQWGKDKTPLWWTAYNNVKHHRHTHFSDANLKHALNAVAGLFVLLLFFYREEGEKAQLNPDPTLFKAGYPFQVDTSFYAPHLTIYQLPNL
ncbi:hypothetical protein [Oxalicibacterium faecigallinarum]|uniref:Uncharacterized protein n=1 Tax=Oxalicibacterium faecigallinarum TaxID=573741 RepID=A0A8J3EYS1_9BURK|nr:hypothetical protein [Oxalicibacterium faecigallinarum]GGI16280.1 hypothetical protein GCM10008066_03170 [Oxalicibacterium faecigallinarum]